MIVEMSRKQFTHACHEVYHKGLMYLPFSCVWRDLREDGDVPFYHCAYPETKTIWFVEVPSGKQPGKGIADVWSGYVALPSCSLHVTFLRWSDQATKAPCKTALSCLFYVLYVLSQGCKFTLRQSVPAGKDSCLEDVVKTCLSSAPNMLNGWTTCSPQVAYASAVQMSLDNLRAFVALRQYTMLRWMWTSTLAVHHKVVVAVDLKMVSVLFHMMGLTSPIFKAEEALGELGEYLVSPDDSAPLAHWGLSLERRERRGGRSFVVRPCTHTQAPFFRAAVEFVRNSWSMQPLSEEVVVQSHFYSHTRCPRPAWRTATPRPIPRALLSGPLPSPHGDLSAEEFVGGMLRAVEGNMDYQVPLTEAKAIVRRVVADTTLVVVLEPMVTQFASVTDKQKHHMMHIMRTGLYVTHIPTASMKNAEAMYCQAAGVLAEPFMICVRHRPLLTSSTLAENRPDPPQSPRTSLCVLMLLCQHFGGLIPLYDLTPLPETPSVVCVHGRHCVFDRHEFVDPNRPSESEVPVMLSLPFSVLHGPDVTTLSISSLLTRPFEALMPPFDTTPHMQASPPTPYCQRPFFSLCQVGEAGTPVVTVLVDGTLHTQLALQPCDYVLIREQVLFPLRNKESHHRGVTAVLAVLCRTTWFGHASIHFASDGRSTLSLANTPLVHVDAEESVEGGLRLSLTHLRSAPESALHLVFDGTEEGLVAILEHAVQATDPKRHALTHAAFSVLAVVSSRGVLTLSTSDRAVELLTTLLQRPAVALVYMPHVGFSPFVHKTRLAVCVAHLRTLRPYLVCMLHQAHEMELRNDRHMDAALRDKPTHKVLFVAMMFVFARAPLPRIIRRLCVDATVNMRTGCVAQITQAAIMSKEQLFSAMENIVAQYGLHDDCSDAALHALHLAYLRPRKSHLHQIEMTQMC